MVHFIIYIVGVFLTPYIVGREHARAPSYYGAGVFHWNMALLWPLYLLGIFFIGMWQVFAYILELLYDLGRSTP